jgi:hypothetical protein
MAGTQIVQCWVTRVSLVLLTLLVLLILLIGAVRAPARRVPTDDAVASWKAKVAEQVEAVGSTRSSPQHRLLRDVVCREESHTSESLRSGCECGANASRMTPTEAVGAEIVLISSAAAAGRVTLGLHCLFERRTKVESATWRASAPTCMKGAVVVVVLGVAKQRNRVPLSVCERGCARFSDALCCRMQGSSAQALAFGAKDLQLVNIASELMQQEHPRMIRVIGYAGTSSTDGV